MKIWAITDTTTGAVVGVQHLSSSNYTDGGAYETGYVTRDITSQTDHESFIDNKYWANNQWNDKPASVGDYYTWNGSAWTLDSESVWHSIRSKRDALLQECDWAVLPDSPLSDSDLTAVKTYRSSLRDVPANAPDDTDHDNDITWPTKPACLG